MKSLTIRYQAQTIRLPMPPNESSVGAAESNDIVVPFPGVSRMHARLAPSDGGAVLTDAGSKNRLVVNGERMDRVELLPGIAVHLGHAVLTIEDASTGDLIVAYPLTTSVRKRTSGERTESHRHSVNDVESRRQSTALAFIRDVECLTPRVLRAKTQTLLESARQLLAAEGVVLFDQTKDEGLVLLAASGALGGAILESVFAGSVSQHDGARVVSSPDGPLAIVLHHQKKQSCGAAALFVRRPVPWEIDFLEYLSRKLRALEGTAPSLEEPARGLSIPAGMIVGTSAAMQSLLSTIASTVMSRLDVLLLGETGTGKELFARMIHESGPTASGPFVAINCAAIPSELLESELFGVQGRVATGVDPRPGLFVQADGGSIFLDEIGELPEALQAKLLRVLQEREVHPLGANRAKKIDVRVIAASNRDLLSRTVEGKFRADLYYRLKGLLFHLPPLRERREDIVPLALSFAARAAEEYRKRVRGISRNAIEYLAAHDWLGNVRELQAEVARAVLLCPGGVLQREHFGATRPLTTPAAAPLAADVASVPPTEDLQTRVDAVARKAIVSALSAARGNKSQAAKTLGVTRNGLAMKMKRLGLR